MCSTLLVPGQELQGVGGIQNTALPKDASSPGRLGQMSPSVAEGGDLQAWALEVMLQIR
jgi:hypothetical protein